jgi:hypothetical protein
MTIFGFGRSIKKGVQRFRWQTEGKYEKTPADWLQVIDSKLPKEIPEIVYLAAYSSVRHIHGPTVDQKRCYLAQLRLAPTVVLMGETFLEGPKRRWVIIDAATKKTAARLIEKYNLHVEFQSDGLVLARQ